MILNMVERLPRVTAVTAFDVLQRPVETSLRAGEFLVVADLAEHPAIVAAVFDNGIWSQKTDGSWVRGRRDEVPDAVLSYIGFEVHRTPAKRVGGTARSPAGAGAADRSR